MRIFEQQYSKYVLIFYLALVLAELLAILWFFTEQKLQNISVTHAVTWWQKLAIDLTYFTLAKVDMKIWQTVTVAVLALTTVDNEEHI